MLSAALALAGAPPEQVLHAEDAGDRTRDLLARLLDARPDCLFITGGVSVGRWDLVRESMEPLGVKTIFWRVAQKPGKPLFAGRRDGTLVLGLPGNPASALVCFYEYGWRALWKSRGREGTGIEEVTATLSAPLHHAPGRTEFIRSRLAVNDGAWLATPESKQGSHLLGPFARANALVVVPADAGDLPAGATVTAHRLPLP
jgi:molybdopterin molybdotransferase